MKIIKREPKTRRGRPSKYTPTTVQTICNAIVDGLPFKYAAMLGGISSDTFCDWQRRFPEFSESIQTASAHGILERLKIIKTAAIKGDVKAAQWWLEHVFPEHFARNRIEVKHQGNIEHQFAVPSALLDELSRARSENECIAD